ncbi:MAG TPA: hypothetical protein VFV34_15875, partial [Blastocatellia bacterium]|nr:hypothetical protein [Blastocatellia bacterium]
MKTVFLMLAILLTATAVCGQATSSVAAITTTYSQNGRFYVKCIPYDNVSPGLRGKSYVYETGHSTPLYTIERGFDSDADSNTLILSDDGKFISSVVPWAADEETEGLKSITIYKNGALLKSFAAEEITGCDKQKE